MPVSCNDNGTICTKFFSESVRTSNTIVGFIIGSIACLVFVIAIVLLMYILCCKKYTRQKLRVPFRSHPSPPTQGIVTNPNRIQVEDEQAQFNSRRSFNDQPPSYQEANINTNTNFSKHI